MSTTLVRIRPEVLESIKDFQDKNPVFESQGEVIEYAVNKLIGGRKI